MCIAIYKPAGKTIAWDALERAFDNNPDGAGFAVRRDNGLYIIKGLMTFEQFKTRFAKHHTYECILHFRWASQGAITKTNTHPFTLPDGSAIVHNGHFAGYGNETISDTRDFLASVLAPLLTAYPDILENPAMRELLNNAIGNSRLAILPKRGKVLLFGEKRGQWKEGCWYSSPIPEKNQRIYGLFGTGKAVSSKYVMADDPSDEEETHTCHMCLEPLDDGYSTLGYPGLCDYCGVEQDPDKCDYCGQDMDGFTSPEYDGRCEACFADKYERISSHTAIEMQRRDSESDSIPF